MTQAPAPPRPAARRTMRAFRSPVDVRPLRIPAYRRLWLATVVTSIGGQFSLVAVPKQLYDLTGSSVYIGVSGLVTLVALAVSALWGGSLADVRDRRRVLLVTSTGIAVTAVLFGVQALARVDSVALLLVLVGAQTLLVGANAATMGAAIPRVVPSALIPAASSLGSLVRYLGLIISPLLAGALIPVIGLRWLYLLDAVALCSVVYAVYRLPAMPPEVAARGNLSHLAQGLRYLLRQPVMTAVICADLAAMVFGLPAALYPQLAHETFGDRAGGGTVLGLIFAAYPAGVVAMGLLSGSVTRVRRHGAMVTVAVICWGLTLIGFGLTHRLWVALLLLALGGAANFILSTFRNAITQLAVADEVRGRAQGAMIAVTMGGPSLGNLLHGTLGATFGTAWAISGGGVLTVVAMLTVVALRPDFWRYRAE